MPRSSNSRRVAVTGVGLVSPLAIGNSENWSALTAGKSGVGPITRFDASPFTCRIAAEVKGFDPSLFIDKKEIKKMDTFIHYAMAAAQFAMEDSALPVNDANRERVAVVVGSGIGGLTCANLLARHGLTYENIDLWEIHEAFAAQALFHFKALEDRTFLRDKVRVDAVLGAFPRERVNPHGGSVALGHPFGATGARILSQAVKELAARPAGARAIVSICADGGQGSVALLQTV